MKIKKYIIRCFCAFTLAISVGGCTSGNAARRPDTASTGSARRTTVEKPLPARYGGEEESIERRYTQLLEEIRRMEPRTDSVSAPPAALPHEQDQHEQDQIAATIIESGYVPDAVIEAPLFPTETLDGGARQHLSNVTVQPEAVIRVRVKEDPSLDGQYVVNDIGAVNFGYVGPIILSNHTEMQAADRIRDVLVNRAFRNATVTVEILRASYDRISVEGHVNRAGLLRIGAGDSISLNDALLRAGGLRGTVRGMQVRVLRGGVTNVLAAAQEGEVYSMQTEDGRARVPDVRLRNNDKLIVFSSQAEAATSYGSKEILVLGEVHRPGPVRFADGEPSSMMHLVFKMGGLPQYANRRAVRVIRRDDNGSEREFSVNVEDIMATGDPERDVPLKHGDRIIVPARRISLF